jgi:hypothetical protein
VRGTSASITDTDLGKGLGSPAHPQIDPAGGCFRVESCHNRGQATYPPGVGLRHGPASFFSTCTAVCPDRDHVSSEPHLSTRGSASVFPSSVTRQPPRPGQCLCCMDRSGTRSGCCPLATVDPLARASHGLTFERCTKPLVTRVGDSVRAINPRGRPSYRTRGRPLVGRRCVVRTRMRFGSADDAQNRCSRRTGLARQSVVAPMVARIARARSTSSRSSSSAGT